MEKLTKEELKTVEKWINNQLEDIKTVIENRKENLLLAFINDDKNELEWQKRDYRELINAKRNMQCQLDSIKYEQCHDEKVGICRDAVRGK